ncbi:MAG TPA: glycosyltransferase [Gammaproteobacteria bacterium]|nr:glycosyltransferase [Gammaproteobacteria bacterium]
MPWLDLALPGCLMWLGVLLVPWQPWRVRERLEADPGAPEPSLDDVTVLIPARDEADVIGETLAGLGEQAPGARVVVIDDGSSDGTAARARAAGAEVITGSPLPEGWAGKLWALEQGRRTVDTPLILLLDADIRLRPGTLAAMRARLRRERLQLVSLMAELRMHSPWERMLLPAFVFFFRLLYPFGLANDPRRRTAAAAGGCLLLEAAALDRAGGFASLRGAIIDDCSLARRIKAAGGRTWVGLSHAAISLRRYERLSAIRDMVARSAYTQLRYSALLLALCTVLMVAAFWLPLAALAGPAPARSVALVSLAAMATAYLPTLRFYRLPAWWCLALPVIGGCFLAMTWISALRYWRGERSRWKGRVYQRG